MAELTEPSSPLFLQASPELHPYQARVTETPSCHRHYGFRPPLVLFGVARIDKTAFTRRKYLPALSCQLASGTAAATATNQEEGRLLLVMLQLSCGCGLGANGNWELTVLA
ncbi:hypothetical protein PIB30_100766 [Stylosanthes scabra]|uniref:Uncharacterized protein n=1 Tax=Stylosanthes scabra TaxID=79078 RepID=A0ABU6UWU3_9FABA|nr:hypothetical protein [Stylosanthes scabra]